MDRLIATGPSPAKTAQVLTIYKEADTWPGLLGPVPPPPTMVEGKDGAVQYGRKRGKIVIPGGRGLSRATDVKREVK